LIPGALGHAFFWILLAVSSDLTSDGFGAATWALTVGFLTLTGTALSVLTVVAAKWALVWKVRRSKHHLWTSFVWRNELVWTFIESLAMPALAPAFLETPAFNLFWRLLGARIGSNVAISTWFLDDPDLISVGDHSVLARSSDLQTHLFQDRVMVLGAVEVGRAVTVGDGSFLLPESKVQDNARIASGSVVPRGEVAVSNHSWAGNPIQAT
jgi:non-ribosomal peptide synthetase-like protein